jgi:RHS repeat-associated protein
MFLNLPGANMKRFLFFPHHRSSEILKRVRLRHHLPVRRLISLGLTCALMAPTLTLAGQPGSQTLSSINGDGFIASVAGAFAAGLRTLFAQGRSADRGMPAKQPLPEKEAPPRPLSKGEREAKVNKLETNIKDELTLEVGREMRLMAVPYEESGDAIHGLSAEWESENPDVASITTDGEVSALTPGKAVLKASAGQKKAHVKLTVVPRTTKPDGSSVAATGSAHDKQNQAGPVITRRQIPGPARGLAPHSDRSLLKAHAGSPSPALFSVNQLPANEVSSIYRAINVVGSPPGRTTPGAAVPAAATDGTETPGSANFNFEVPIVNLPGRGLDAGLTLVYNSRLWNKSTPSPNETHLSYDVDGGWPAPGFRLGYGKLEFQNDFNLTLTDPDGTRHPLQGDGISYDSTDGTFIHVSIANEINISATFADGTRVKFDAGSAPIYYPSLITDRNGNFITIGYEGTSARITSIQDTLGRHLNFFYDPARHDLVTITAPGLGNNGDRQMIRFYYDDLVFSGSLFQSSAHPSFPVDNKARIITDVYLASSGDSANTQTSYHYDYSSYGMIRQIKKYAGRTITTTGDSRYNAGTINNDGSLLATTTYDYPGGAVNLADVPTYGTRTDDWTGRTLATAPAYAFVVDPSTGISKVTSPDGSISETHSITNSGQWNEGMVDSVSLKEMVNDQPRVLSSTNYTWELDSSGQNPRIKQIDTINDAHQRKSTVLSYTSYNNLFASEEYGFVPDTSPPGTLGTKLKSTGFTYVADTQYTSRGLVHLPASMMIASGDGTVATHAYYYYDEYTDSAVGTLMDRPSSAGMHDTAYNTAMTARGNLTSIRNLRDPYNYSTFVNTYSSYDVLGNVVAETVNCCRRKVISYDYSASLPDYYKYAYPVSVTRGDAGQLTNSVTYDLNTGVVNTQTDENNKTTYVYYRSNSLRPWEIDYPGGGKTNYNYGDWPLFNDPDAAHAHTYINTTTWLDTSSNPQKYSDSYQFMDGRGAVARTFGSYTQTNGWVARDIEYNAMGQVKRSSNPYYNNGATGPLTPDASPLWTTSAYDRLGRVTSLSMPGGDDAAHSQARISLINYAGTVTTVTDAAGRQRRQTLDELGRLKQVDEQDPQSLALTQSTTYDYDALDHLTHTKQDLQERFFKYDAMGHLTYEKQPEQAAPYTDPYDPNKHWSAYYVYDNNELLNDTYDARGIHTHLDYDGLNRPWRFTYTGESAPVQTPQLTYTYDEARNNASGQPYANKAHLTSVTTAAGTSVPQTRQEFNYDAAGRVVAQKQIVGTNIYSLSYGYNVAGELTSEQYPSGRLISYNYDDAGRLSTVVDQTHSFITGAGYTPHGAISSLSLGNQAVQNITYNLALQPLSISLTKGSVLSRFDYQYGVIDETTGVVDQSKNTGQVARIEGYTGTTKQWQQRLSYDSVGRLKKAAEYRGDNSAQVYQSTYDYDRFGNRAQPATLNPSNPLLPYPPVELTDYNTLTNRYTSGVTYDGAGNIMDDARFAGNPTRHALYRYDANGRQVWTSFSDNTGTLSAVYDGMGQRVQSISATETRTLIFDIFGQVVAEYGGQTTQQTSGVRYMMLDHQGSARVLMNESGAVVARHDYTAFGMEIGQGVGMRNSDEYSANPSSTVKDDTRDKYAAMGRDENGLDHTPWRKYESWNGRWTSPDPYTGSMNAGDPQSLNRYAYVQNDPVNFLDPSGLLRIQQCTRDWHIDINGNKIYTSSVCWVIYDDSGGDAQNVGYMDPKYKDGFKKAFDEAEKRLKGKCADLFGGREAALAMLRATEYRVLPLAGGGPKLDPQTGQISVTGAQTNSPTSVFINSKGPFFNNRMVVPGTNGMQLLDFKTGLTGAQFGALLLLHELGHQSKRFGADADNLEKNLKHTKEVYKACF